MVAWKKVRGERVWTWQSGYRIVETAILPDGADAGRTVEARPKMKYEGMVPVYQVFQGRHVVARDVPTLESAKGLAEGANSIQELIRL